MHCRSNNPLETRRREQSAQTSTHLVSNSARQGSTTIPLYRPGCSTRLMKILTWNISGACNKDEELEALITETEANVCVLTETWIRPGQNIPCTWPVGQMAEAEKRGRLGGGTAMLVKPGIRFKLIRKIYNGSAFAVWIGLQGNVDVIGTSLRPGALPEHADNRLHEIQARACYPTIVAGDLNARHRDWCTKTNRSGRKLKAWASQYRFSVTAPRDPMFVSKQGRSTIDIYASRGITLTTPNTVSSRGPWGGASDHIPVITVTSTKTCTTPHSRLPPHISTRLLSSIVHLEKAENLYEEVIPQLTADKEIAESPEELGRIYVEFQKVMLRPLRIANSNLTVQFQSHWEARLEALARERDKIFRELKNSRQDCTALWLTFHALDKQIKRSVRNKKKGIRRQERNAMVQKSVPETQKWVKKYLRRSNTAAMQSLQRGSPLDLASFTRHMETKRNNIARIPTRNFIVLLDFCSHIQRSISILPNGSAAGRDMLYYEMFKINTDTPAQFLMAL